MTIKTTAVAVAAAALLAPAAASAHTTISALQPQGPILTSARTSYVVRSPNETPSQSTWKIVMYVPKEIQTLISVKQLPDWKARVKQHGDAITQVSWTAKTREDEIPPRFFGEWPVRFQNPAQAGKYCFGFSQFSTNPDGTRRKPDIVNWTGPADAEHPASCITVTDS